MPRPRVSDIVTVASRLAAVNEAEVLGDRRLLHLCAVRAAVYVASRKHGYSYPAIGRAVGRRDHTTVIYAIRNIKRHALYFKDFDGYCKAVEEISAELPPFVRETDWTPDQTFQIYLSRVAHYEIKNGRIIPGGNQAKKPVGPVGQVPYHRADAMESGSGALLDALRKAAA